MESDLFNTYFSKSSIGEKLSQIAVWAKWLGISGLVMQLLMLCFAGLHYHQYTKYLSAYPKAAPTYLRQSIVEIIQALVYGYINVLFYRMAVAIQRAIENGGNDWKLEYAFSRNLRLLKLQCFTVLATIIYYAWLLAVQLYI